LRKRERGSTNESTKREQGSAPVLHSVETKKKKKKRKKKKEGEEISRRWH
jgi:hypothetical protein